MRNMVTIACLLCATGGAHAATLTWTDWTGADTASASGTLGAATVSFTGDVNPTAQTNGGTDFWGVNSSIYTPTGAENPPPGTDIIRLTGGSGTGTQTVTFSSAIVNPMFAIMSLGQTGLTAQYDFDVPFSILNQGSGYWGGSGTALSVAAGDILQGNEGHGLIQFQGTFTSISWTMPISEFWHGFQVGYVDSDQNPAPIPLPAAAWLLLAGLAGLGFLRKRG